MSAPKVNCARFFYCGRGPDHDGDCELRLDPGFQEDFASNPADGTLAAGIVGAGKSVVMLAQALRGIHLPGFTAAIVRKEQRDLLKSGGLWQKSELLYPYFGGVPQEAELTWKFPSKARIQFGYVDSRRYEQQWRGSEICYLGIDELPDLSRREALFMLGRNRSSCGLRPWWNATANADRDSWLREWVDWWIGPDGWPVPARNGAMRFYLIRGGKTFWASSRAELHAQFPSVRPDLIRSFAMISPTGVSRFLLDYEGNIEAQEDGDRERMKGNWNAGRREGRAFQDAWFLDAAGRIREDRYVDRVPAGTRWCRAWDTAATPEAECTGATSHSYTAGPLLGLTPDGRLIIADLDLGRWSAGVVEEVVRDAAARDRARFGQVRIHFCREHAGAGKGQLDSFVRLLSGYDVDGEPESGDKGVRMRPLVAQAEHGHVYFLRPRPEGAPRPGAAGRHAPDDTGDWVWPFLRHLFALTTDGKGKPNDVGDGCTAALRVLAGADDSAQEAEELREAFYEDQRLAPEITRGFDVHGAFKTGSW